MSKGAKMSMRKKSFGTRLLSRAALLAEGSMLCLASSVATAAVIDSGPVNISLPATNAGLYINVLTGATGTSSGAVAGWDFNPYLTGTGLGIYWNQANIASVGGVVAPATTTPLLVLAPGATISVASTFSASIQAASSFRVTQDAFMGFRFFNETTSATNYGYAELSTTATNGYPATLVHYVYENTGAPITIPSTPVTLQSFEVN
jgi:hypothetical protein